jgi:hypothetical protein
LNDSTLNAEYGNNLHDVPHDSAKGAEYESQGQARSASPLDQNPQNAGSPERAKYFRPFRPSPFWVWLTMGDVGRRAPPNAQALKFFSRFAPLALFLF